MLFLFLQWGLIINILITASKVGAIKQWFQAFYPEEKKKFFVNFGLLSGGLVGFYYFLVGSKEFGSATTINCVWIFIYFTIAILILRKQKDPISRKITWSEQPSTAGAPLSAFLSACSPLSRWRSTSPWVSHSDSCFPIFFGNTTPRNTNPGFKHNCCYTCSRYAYGQCLENPGQATSDPGSTKCGKYMQA